MVETRDIRVDDGALVVVSRAGTVCPHPSLLLEPSNKSAPQDPWHRGDRGAARTRPSWHHLR